MKHLFVDVVASISQISYSAIEVIRHDSVVYVVHKQTSVKTLQMSAIILDEISRYE